MARDDPTLAEAAAQLGRRVRAGLSGSGAGARRLQELTRRFGEDAMALCCHLRLAQTLEDRQLILWQDERWYVLVPDVGLSPRRLPNAPAPPVERCDEPDRGDEPEP